MKQTKTAAVATTEDGKPKPQNPQILLRMPSTLEEWLTQKVETRGRGSRQDVILDLLIEAKKAEAEAAASQ
jgi:Arc/MetJ-type ribon-helix-helix transcriptional regulator